MVDELVLSQQDQPQIHHFDTPSGASWCHTDYFFIVILV